MNYLYAGAKLSGLAKYRFSLVRIWDADKPFTSWICLNPSTADATKDDATVRKIRGFSERWGYGGFALFNLLAYRTTDPAQLTRALVEGSVYAPENSAANIMAAAHRMSGRENPVLAWGNIAIVEFRLLALEVVKLCPFPRVLSLTRSGSPRHPSRFPYMPAPIVIAGGKLRIGRLPGETGREQVAQALQNPPVDLLPNGVEKYLPLPVAKLCVKTV